MPSAAKDEMSQLSAFSSDDRCLISRKAGIPTVQTLADRRDPLKFCIVRFMGDHYDTITQVYEILTAQRASVQVIIATTGAAADFHIESLN